MVVDKKRRQLNRNRGIDKTQLGFSLDQQNYPKLPWVYKIYIPHYNYYNAHYLLNSSVIIFYYLILVNHMDCGLFFYQTLRRSDNHNKNVRFVPY